MRRLNDKVTIYQKSSGNEDYNEPQEEVNLQDQINSVAETDDNILYVDPDSNSTQIMSLNV